MIKGEVETMRMWVSMFSMIKGKVETMRMWGGYGYHDKGRDESRENVGESKITMIKVGVEGMRM